MNLKRLARNFVGQLRSSNPRHFTGEPGETPDMPLLSDDALNASREIRSRDRKPAVMIFGVMPRSGTVYVGKVLGLHPSLFEHPNHLWEIPFLERTSDLLAFQKGFFKGYRQNQARMGQLDLLPIFGAAFIAYLNSFVPPGRRVLIKETSMRSFDYFPTVFPYEQLLMLMRDGRDVVSSTVRTWPTVDFDAACRKWAESTRIMLEFDGRAGNQRDDYWRVKFEDVLERPADFVHEACRRFGLDPSAYPYDKLDEIKVIGSSTMSDAGKVDWSKHVSAAPDFKPTRHWLEWSASKKRTFKRLAGDLLIKAGYVPDSSW